MSNIHLNTKIFDTDVEQVPIRKGFGEGLLESAKKNQNIVGLCADLTESTQMHLFKKEFPDRFIEIGVAEQNLASVASGMAAMGKLPFITSYAMFSPGRNWEQIRTTICYNDQKVIIAGSHAGVSVGPDGGTHQAIEDIAITRVIPNMTVIVPCDAVEAKKATMVSALRKEEGGTNTPVYIRLAREKSPVITTSDTPFEIGKAQVFYELDTDRFLLLEQKRGNSTSTFKLDSDTHGIRHDVAILACGALVHNALLAAKQLEEEGIAAKVLNMATIKPLDIEAVLSVAKETGALVTVEEHQIAGGLGGAVAETVLTGLKRGQQPVLECVGVHDRFGQSGTPQELIKEYGMTVSDIVAAVRRALARK
ncbi:MAG: transketolase family protein [Candidatus Taylorbacteria bacterium]|nr:transketolase family protein [Candidatus Taylorbacteria bacterium]